MASAFRRRRLEEAAGLSVVLVPGTGDFVALRAVDFFCLPTAGSSLRQLASTVHDDWIAEVHFSVARAFSQTEE